MKKLVVLLSSLFLVQFYAVAGDVTLVKFETRDVKDEEDVQKGVMYFRDNMLRLDLELNSLGDPETSLIYRGDRGLMWVLQHDEKRYLQMDRETMERMTASLSGVMEQLQAQLSQMPPEQRKAVEEMMKNRLPDARGQSAAKKLKRDLRKTSETKTVNGYPATKYEVYVSGNKESELWVTPYSRLNVEGNLTEVLQSMEEFYSSLTSTLPGGMRDSDIVFGAPGELDGFPVLVRQFENGEVQTETTVQEVIAKNMPDGLFEPNPGYSKSELSQEFGRSR